MDLWVFSKRNYVSQKLSEICVVPIELVSNITVPSLDDLINTGLVIFQQEEGLF